MFAAKEACFILLYLEPILRLFNLLLQRQLRAFLHQRKIILILKTRHAISCAVKIYNVVTQVRRIGSWV
jgi:hypothetical protein